MRELFSLFASTILPVFSTVGSTPSSPDFQKAGAPFIDGSAAFSPLGGSLSVIDRGDSEEKRIPAPRYREKAFETPAYFLLAQRLDSAPIQKSTTTWKADGLWVAPPFHPG